MVGTEPSVVVDVELLELFPVWANPIAIVAATATTSPTATAKDLRLRIATGAGATSSGFSAGAVARRTVRGSSGVPGSPRRVRRSRFEASDAADTMGAVVTKVLRTVGTSRSPPTGSACLSGRGQTV
jgi:hypothetical protein